MRPSSASILWIAACGLALSSCVTSTKTVLMSDYPKVREALLSMESEVKDKNLSYRGSEIHVRDSWHEEIAQPPRLKLRFFEGYTCLGPPQYTARMEAKPHADGGTDLAISVRETSLFFDERRPDMETDWLKRILSKLQPGCY